MIYLILYFIDQFNIQVNYVIVVTCNILIQQIWLGISYTNRESKNCSTMYIGHRVLYTLVGNYEVLNFK